MVIVYLLIWYYATSLLIVWGFLAAMHSIYRREEVKVPWWPYTKITLIPFVGSILACLVIFVDFRHHVINQERRRRKEYLEDATRK